MKIKCSRCGAALLETAIRYHLEARLYAAPDIAIDDAVLKLDMAALIKAASRQKKRELEEEVFTSFKFILCPLCRRVILTQLKRAARQGLAGIDGHGTAAHNKAAGARAARKQGSPRLN